MIYVIINGYPRAGSIGTVALSDTLPDGDYSGFGPPAVWAGDINGPALIEVQTCTECGWLINPDTETCRNCCPHTSYIEPGVCEDCGQPAPEAS